MKIRAILGNIIFYIVVLTFMLMSAMLYNSGGFFTLAVSALGFVAAYHWECWRDSRAKRKKEKKLSE